MNGVDMPLALFVFYGVIGAVVLVLFVSACWLAATTNRRGDRRW